MRSQRFMSPEDAIEVFKNHILKVSQSEWKTNTNDGRTAKHSEYGYANKCQTFPWKCQISPGNTRNMLGPKCI